MVSMREIDFLIVIYGLIMSYKKQNNVYCRNELFMRSLKGILVFIHLDVSQLGK